MGILLPPVSQVTNTRINITQHHRNRSLDSALQRIPEVEVSSPNAESENTFCTPVLLGSTMCSKIATTAANVTAALTTIQSPAPLTSAPRQSADSTAAAALAAPDVINTESQLSTKLTSTSHREQTPPTNTLQSIAKAISAGSDIDNSIAVAATAPSSAAIVAEEPYRTYSNTIINRKEDSCEHRPLSSKSALRITSSASSSVASSSSDTSLANAFTAAANAVASNVCSNVATNSNTNSNNNCTKKREDLTSLGSDDSGIICGSDSDQISLNRIRRSHESLDSGEMDAEEECIEMLETTSMDEEYNMLQSDLCFYQTPDIDCRTLRPARKKQSQHNQLVNMNNDNKVKVVAIENLEDVRAAGDSDQFDKCHNYGGDIQLLMDAKVVKDVRKSLSGSDNESAAVIPPAAASAVASAVAVVAAVVTNTSESLDAATPTTVLPPISSTNPKTQQKTSEMNLTTVANTTIITTTTVTTTPTETIKNDVLFKNFFGATKNAIFRTAQSIIENHEKKNASKQNHRNLEDNSISSSNSSGSNTTAADQAKSPTELCKKKEFFGLLSTNASKKAAVAAATAAAAASTASPAAVVSTNNTPVTTPTSPSDHIISHNTSNTNSSSNSHVNVGKISDGTGGVVERTEKTLSLQVPPVSIGATCVNALPKSSSISSLNKLKVPGVVKCFIKERPCPAQDATTQHKTEKGPSGLLRFFESPVFNIHFAIHYLFYSKEPGVLSFIGNKIFSFPDQEVDLYIPQLIVMYIQMDELAEVLDPYLTIRCRKSVDFSLKCLWLLEAYNYQPVDTMGKRKPQLALMKEIYSKKERKQLSKNDLNPLTASVSAVVSPLTKKTHHRSQSDATVLLTDCKHSNITLSISNRLYQQPPYTTQTLPVMPAKLCLGDLTSGRAFDNGCTCFETVRGQVNHLLGQKTLCACSAPKTAPQREFMKALINVGKNLTALPSKAEKTSALRMFLNLINKNLPARVWLPLYSHIPHHVVRITEEKTAVLNSKDKTPYIIYVEVVEVPDIYSSALIPKMMPSLRHTKSEEHLEGGSSAMCQPNLMYNTCSRSSSSSCSSQGTKYNCVHKKEKLTNESSNTTVTVAAAAGATNDQHLSCAPAFTATATATLLPPQLNGDDIWSQEDDEITAQYLHMRKMRSNCERDAVSQMSLDSCDSRDPGMPVLFNIGDVRSRHCNNLNCENTKSFSNDPEDPSAAALKEPWHEKEKQIRNSSPYGHLSNWRLLSAIVKCGDDLRQELMATQLLQMFKIIWQEENVDLWVRPYKIVCLSNDSGLIEPILNTVSLHQIKKNSNKSLYDYFVDEYGPSNSDAFRMAQKNFVQSCAAYCIISYLLQVKDRHNGNILLHSDGHIIHIDFGFILSISPKNLGFEQSPFKLTPEFVDVMGGMNSEHWQEFNRLLLVGMMAARKHMDRIINFVEIMRSNAQLPCFKNGCSGTVQNLRKRFHMNLTEQEMERKVEQLVQDSLKSLSTKLYDGYQYYTNGIL